LWFAGKEFVIAMAKLTHSQSRGFLTRLAQDRRGNMLVISAVSLVPMLAIVGSGIDISRYYLAKNRLQHACDAGVLATRKSMSGFALTDAAKAVGQSFFKVNFPAGVFATTSPLLVLTAEEDGTVNGVATVTSGESLMGSFGMDAKKLTNTCSAKMDLPNTDILFALDTTGSMKETNPGDSVSRIVALRNAVRGFTTTLDNIAAGGVQVRYGFVPFSSTVNVGRLLRREWMVDKWTYQSRMADTVETQTGGNTWNETTKWGNWTNISGSYNESVYTGSAEKVNKPGEPAKPGSGGEIGGSSGSPAKPPSSYWKCTGVPGDNAKDSWTNTSWVYSPYPGGGQQRTRTNTRTRNGTDYDSWVSGSTCYIKKKVWSNHKQSQTETVIPVGGSNSWSNTKYWWVYKPVEYNVSALKGSGPLMKGVSFVVPKLGKDHTSATITWDGCIEERDTIRNKTFPTIPTAAYDLDIDKVPDNDATRWRPFLPELVFWRKDNQNWDKNDWRTTDNSTRADEFSGGEAAVCPTEARKLAVMSAAQVSQYVDSLAPRGTTYLDIGMIWAGRLISPTGLWKSENTVATNGGAISRHVIFMTDGKIETKNMVYETYGLSALDRRRSDQGTVPNDNETNENVDARFRAVCEAVKGKGITVWTIAFGTELTDGLKACATDERFYKASNAAELNAAFTNIASNIARLRLTK
jgi:Flp pilus assembly protein TadG